MNTQSTELPKSSEIDKLPLLARVAFAARCARRCQPALADAYEGSPAASVLIQALGAGLEVAEHSAFVPEEVSLELLCGAAEDAAAGLRAACISNNPKAERAAAAWLCAVVVAGAASDLLARRTDGADSATAESTVNAKTSQAAQAAADAGPAHQNLALARTVRR